MKTLDALEQSLVSRRGQFLLTLFLGILVATMVYRLNLDHIRFFIFDESARVTTPPRPTGDVILVATDKPEPTADDYVLVLRNLLRAQPRWIMTLVDPSHIQGSQESRKRFAEASERAHLVFGKDDVVDVGQRELPPLPPPFEKIPVKMAPLTADRSIFSEDGVTRRAILQYGDLWIDTAKLASDYNGIKDPKAYRGTFLFIDSLQTFIRFRAPGAFVTLNFADVKRGHFGSASLRDKIVLIGSKSPRIQPLQKTPLDSSGISGLETQANVIDSLIANQAPLLPPSWQTYILILLISWIAIWFLWSQKPQSIIFLLVTLTLVIVAVGIFITPIWFAPTAQLLTALWISAGVGGLMRWAVQTSMERKQLRRQGERTRQMAHDIRSPISALNLILRNVERMTPEHADIIRGVSERINRIAEDVLKPPEKPPNPAVFDVVKTTQAITRQMQAAWPNVHFHAAFSDGGDLKLSQSLAPEFERILANLLTNAIESLSDRREIHIEAHRQGALLALTIRDSGRGMPREILEQIGSRQITTKGRDGNGIGLYSAFQKVRSWGGSIEILSEEGKGTEVKIHLPMPPALSKG